MRQNEEFLNIRGFLLAVKEVLKAMLKAKLLALKVIRKYEIKKNQTK